MSFPYQSATTAIRPSRGNHAEVFEESLAATAEALHRSGAASHAELSRGLAAARSAHEEGLQADLLECMARTLGHIEEQLSPVIAGLGDAVASTFTQAPPLIPFAGKLIAPNAFYESHGPIRNLAKVLLAPILFAEDSDAIGIGSINPVAASILAEEVTSTIERRFGIRPFITIIRLDYESWTFLGRKHFNR